MTRYFGYILFILLLTPPLDVDAGGEPMQVLESNISRAIHIINDPQYAQGGGKDNQFQELWELLQQSFDFHEFSRRVLATHGRGLTGVEREAFVDVFSRFLGQFYLRKVLELYDGERVIYLDQQMVSDGKAIVSVKVLRKGLEVPVKVKMSKRSGTWKVYDLVFLGISGVSNYRAQFRFLLKDHTPAQVIRAVRERLEARNE